MKKYFLLLLLLLPFFLDGSSLRADDQELQYEGVSYVCTGVAESKDDPRWKTYPLKLMFAGSSNAYITDVKVELKDKTGNLVLKVACDAPWLLAKLKPGKYSGQALAEKGTPKFFSVNVPEKGQSELAIHFPGIP